MRIQSKNTQDESGFTIIEVVIVLALAAFIFTIVFFAVPQLQRALRNNQRERDVSRVAAAVIEYQAAHDGNLPTGTAAQRTEERAWLENYMGGSEFKDVSGNRYLVYTGTWYNSNIAQYTSSGRDMIYVAANSQCDSSRSREAGPADAGTSVSVKLYREGSDNSISGSASRSNEFICKTVTR